MGKAIFLDVKDLPPPEPLVLALDAVDKLKNGEHLKLHHRRNPCALLPQLTSRGFEYKITIERDGFCEVLVWRKGENPPEEI